jgi:N6-adenosine-specific RNA methylase IME4
MVGLFPRQESGVPAQGRRRAKSARSWRSPSSEITRPDIARGTQRRAAAFGVIYADPPWTPGQTGPRGAAQKYSLLPTSTICEMPVADLAADNCVLLLWVVNNGLDDGLAVMRAWQFRYVTNAVWAKGTLGLGAYFRGAHELLLLGVKGRPRVKFHGQPSVFHEPRQEHSRKPAEITQKIERMFDGPYLELFARETPNSLSDWSVWGDQIASDITIPGFPVPSDGNARWGGGRNGA